MTSNEITYGNLKYAGLALTIVPVPGFFLLGSSFNPRPFLTAVPEGYLEEWLGRRYERNMRERAEQQMRFEAQRAPILSLEDLDI